jgi:hypothetical protein
MVMRSEVLLDEFRLKLNLLSEADKFRLPPMSSVPRSETPSPGAMLPLVSVTSPLMLLALASDAPGPSITTGPELVPWTRKVPSRTVVPPM